MPLGNHTSQFFANVYLNELDQFVKHVLKAQHYIRYVDDFVILSDSRPLLEDYKKKISAFLNSALKLELHREKSNITTLHQGVPFLGYRIFYHHKLLRLRNVRAFEKKMRKLRIIYHERKISRDKVVEQLEGWLAYAEHANTYAYRREMLRKFNRFFPFRIEQTYLSKKARNFYKKVAASKMEFSTQKTLALVKKKLTVEEITRHRGIKEGTVWEHIAELIEHGWLSIWKIMPRNKITEVIPKIRKPTDTLKEIKARFRDKSLTFNEIACVKAHIKYKEKIKFWMKKKSGR